MTYGLQGANLEEMRRLAHDLELASAQLQALRTELNQRISAHLAWEGSDAFVFRHAWQSSYSPVIAKGVAMLTETAQKIRHQAAEQQETSA